MPCDQSVLILSADFLFTEGVKSFVLQSTNYRQVNVAADFFEFEHFTKDLNPALIILDLSSSLFKVEKVIAFVSITAQSKILLMGGVLSNAECDQLRQWGAHAICLKSSNKKDIEDCLNALVSNQFYLGNGVVEEKEILENNLMLRLNISEREQEIIKLIAEGYINKEIAEQLFLSTHTINTHRKNIMQKLGINNTAGIVLFAVQQKIITPSEFLFH